VAGTEASRRGRIDPATQRCPPESYVDLSWFFALGVGLWLWAPVVADSAAGGLLAAAGLLLTPGAVVAEIQLRRRDLDTDPIR
jgi:hypothetical protein